MQSFANGPGRPGWLVADPNIMGYAATMAAYRDGQPWLDALLHYLEGNRDWLHEYVHAHLPGITMGLPEGTYLAWLDCRQASLPDLRVIVVDDGSADGTAGVVRTQSETRPWISLVQHERNMGLSQAIQTGFQAALKEAGPGDVIVTLDADNTQSPDTIPAMLARLAEGYDVVVASRFQPGAQVLFGKAQRCRAQLSETKTKKEQAQRQGNNEQLYYYGALGAFALALGTKAVILSLPLLLFAFAYFFSAEEEQKHWLKDTLKRLSPFFALVCVRLYLHYSFQKPDIIYALKDNLVWRERLDFLSNLLTQCHMVIHYLKLAVFPVSLNIDHDVPPVQSLLDVSALIGIATLAGLVGLAFLLHRRSNCAAFGVVWFFLSRSWLSSPPEFSEAQLKASGKGNTICKDPIH